MTARPRRSVLYMPGANPRALAKAIRKALVLYSDKELLAHYRQNGMARDFSWEQTALAYVRAYSLISTLAPALAEKV